MDSSGPDSKQSASANQTNTAAVSCDDTGQLFLFGPMYESSVRSKYIPTPTQGDAKASGSRNTANSNANPGLSLTDYVRGDQGTGRMWPTPKRSDHTPGHHSRANHPRRRNLNDSVTSSAADSHASRLALPVLAKVMPTSAGSGQKCAESLAKLNPGGSWSKMYQGYCQLTLDGSSEEFCETWPRSGCLQNGTAYLLPPLTLLTDEIEFGLLPTPAATAYGTNQGGAAGRTGPVRPSLETMARKNMWPTPQAWDYKSGTGYSHGDKSQTPQLRHMSGGLLNPMWVEWLLGFPIGWTALDH